MTTSTFTPGTQIAADLRDATELSPYTTEKLVSLQDLLNALQEKSSQEFPMLRSTAAKLAEFYAKPVSEVPLDSLPDVREDFRDYLKGHRYAGNSVRSYVNYLNILVSKAKGLGWKQSPSVIPSAWMPLHKAIMNCDCGKLLRWLVGKGKLPSTVHEKDLSDWVGMRVKNGRSYAGCKSQESKMRRILVQAGFAANLAANKVLKSEYGVRLELFPDGLRAQVQDVLLWKQSNYNPTRPKKAQIRAVSAVGLVAVFCRLYGFVVNVKGIRPVTTLRELVTKEHVDSYIEWCLNVRQVRSRGVSMHLGRICAALSQNPKYADITKEWFPDLLKTIPDDADGEDLQRKEAKYLPHAVVAGIPDIIRRRRSDISQGERKAIALSVRDELLIKLLITIPWRQRNIRECRIGGQNPNLFRAELPKLTSVNKPDWLQKDEQQHGPREVWQFRFSADETKTHDRIHCVLPQPLISLLEEYLTEHRPHLTCESDPGTVFVGERGEAMTSSMLRTLVSRLTLKHGGRAVNPHLFRDIYAYMWLEKAPEDYLTLSLLLWHRNIQTTIKIYGRRYNHSAALCRMERVLFG